MTGLDPFEQLCGAEILAIAVEEHVAVATRSLVSVYLEIRYQTGLRLRVAPSGWGLAWGVEQPHPADLGVAGRVEVRGVTNDDLLPVGLVVRVWEVRASGEATPAGVRWQNTSGRDVVVYAYDDTLLVASPDGLELDDVMFTSVCGPPQ